MGKDIKGKELGGGLSQRKDGKYSARYTSATGKRVEKYFKTLNEAKRWLAEATYSESHGNIAAGSGMLFSTWFWYWLDNIKGDTIREGSRDVYRNRFKSRVEPVIGSIPLAEIKPLHCQMILDKSKKEGECYDSVKKLRSILYSVFNAAYENDLISKNPVTSNVKAGGDKAKERRILTKDEHAAFLEASKGSLHYDFFAFCLQTGLRGGEESGLKWSDVDWDRREFTVNRTLEFRKGQFIENPPKTEAGHRVVPLTDEAYEILLRLRKARAKRKVMFGFHEYIFLNRNGKPNHRHIYNRSIKKIGKSIGVEGLTVHSLRHTFATRCIEAGMKPKTLQKIMGHSSLKITMDLYVHVTDDELHSEMRKLTGVKLA